MKKKKHHTVGTIPNSTIKFVESGKIDTSDKHIHSTIEYLQKCVTLYPSNTVGVTVGAEAAYLSGTLDA
jgi:hypothetical protein